MRPLRRRTFSCQRPLGDLAHDVYITLQPKQDAAQRPSDVLSIASPLDDALQRVDRLEGRLHTVLRLSINDLWWGERITTQAPDCSRPVVITAPPRAKY